jgi:hypothetical protein
MKQFRSNRLTSLLTWNPTEVKPNVYLVGAHWHQVTLFFSLTNWCIYFWLLLGMCNKLNNGLELYFAINGVGWQWTLPNHTHNTHPCQHEDVRYSKQWDHLIIPLFPKPIASSGSSNTLLKLFCNQLQASKWGWTYER